MKFWRFCLSVLVFVLVSNVLIVITTTILHEMGHLFVGILYGCRGKIIFLDTETLATYSQLICEETNIFISIGSFIFTIPFALLFLLLKPPERNFFKIIFGLSIFSGSLDISEAFGLPFLFYIPYIIGFIIICYGECILIDNVIKRYKSI
jgi:hypothetical protein